MKFKIAEYINHSRQLVYLRKDFADLGSYRLVGQALREFVREGSLARIGWGLYARLRPSTISPDKRVFATSGGFKAISRAALDRLKIPWRPCKAEEDYNKGISRTAPQR